ncbi:MAG: site-2 protease family protein [Methylococcaceae bacterium]|nr:site-2 protease family protein [Methylococcaceae bacterium]
MEDNLIKDIAGSLLPILFAITMHEVAHGWAALMLGDKTAARMGRLSLNPIHHIDPIGTVLVPSLSYLFGGFLFGWAKPVPVNFGRLRNPRRDSALVALAGPMANLLMAIGWALMVRLAHAVDIENLSAPLAYMGERGIGFNLVLMLLNLLPILPLDGGRIVSALLPPRVSYRYDATEQYGMLIMLVLIAIPGLLGVILGPPMAIFLSLMSLFAGLPG